MARRARPAALLCMPEDDAATARVPGRLALSPPSDARRRMGAAQSRVDALRKRRELADFLSRPRASESTFSDSDSDGGGSGDGGGPRREALVMLPSALDPRGRTIRRVQIDPPAPAPRRRKAPAAPRFDVSAAAFEYLKVLGVGGTGRVLLVRCRHDQQLYAMKVYPKQSVRASRLTRNVLSERDVLGGTDHPTLSECGPVAGRVQLRRRHLTRVLRLPQHDCTGRSRRQPACFLSWTIARAASYRCI